MFTFISGFSDPALPSAPGLHVSSAQDLNPNQKCHLIRNIKEDQVADSAFFQEPNLLACFDGVLINSPDLKKRHAAPGTESMLKDLLTQRNESMLTELYGQFCGMSYRVGESAWFFSNQTGSPRIYHWHQDDKLIVSSSLAMIVAVLKMNGFKPGMDEIGARMLMVLGYTLSDYSTVEGIKLLEPGQALNWDSEGLKIHTYFRFEADPKHGDTLQTLREMDELFKTAVDLEYHWNQVHDRCQLAFLSGGLDSRMSIYHAVALGYQDTRILNFSQSGYLDQKIAQTISKKLGLHYGFFPLDKGSYLFDVEDALLYNDGQIYYPGAAHLYAAVKSADLQGVGIIHTGQTGDVVLNSYQARQTQNGDFAHLGFGTENDPELHSMLSKFAAKYASYDLFVLYNKGFNAASNGDFAVSLFKHASSPFLYPPFTQFCQNIQPRFRENQHIYLKWFNELHPDAARITWDKTGQPLNAKPVLFKTAVQIRRVKQKLARLGIIKPFGMNPFARWLKENPALAAELDHRYEKADEYGIMEKSSLADLYRTYKRSPHFFSQMAAYTAAHSLNQMLGDGPVWIPPIFTGGFNS